MWLILYQGDRKTAMFNYLLMVFLIWVLHFPEIITIKKIKNFYQTTSAAFLRKSVTKVTSDHLANASEAKPHGTFLCSIKSRISTKSCLKVAKFQQKTCFRMKQMKLSVTEKLAQSFVPYQLLLCFIFKINYRIYSCLIFFTHEPTVHKLKNISII